MEGLEAVLGESGENPTDRRKSYERRRPKTLHPQRQKPSAWEMVQNSEADFGKFVQTC